MKRILLVPDAHHPYHDRRAWATMLAAGRAFKPDWIVILGDFGDFYCISDHRRDPRRNALLRREVQGILRGLDDLDALGARRKDYILGNHEDRLERYLIDRAPELFDVVNVPDLLELGRRGWNVIPYRDHLQVGKAYFTHDVGSAGRRAHEGAADAYQANAGIGHTHRAAITYVGNQRGSAHFGAMFGWLGDARKAEYLHRAKRARDWCHAFGLAYLEPQGRIHVQLVPIIAGTALVEGQVVRA